MLLTQFDFPSSESTVLYKTFCDGIIGDLVSAGADSISAFLLSWIYILSKKVNNIVSITAYDLF